MSLAAGSATLCLAAAAKSLARFRDPLAHRPGAEPRRDACAATILVGRRPCASRVGDTLPAPLRSPSDTHAEALTGGSIALAKSQIAAAPRSETERSGLARSSPARLRRGRFLARRPARRDVPDAG